MEEEKEEKKESELLEAMRKHYEAIIQDKDKIIKQLIDKPLHEEKQDKQEKQEEKEEKDEKSDEEKRREKRMAYYKKYIR